MFFIKPSKYIDLYIERLYNLSVKICLLYLIYNFKK